MLRAKSVPRTTQQISLNLSGDLESTDPDFDPLLDEDWCYHLFCVNRIQGEERGVMYDVGGGDSNNIPREGAAIACSWPFPKDGQWGDPGKLKQLLQDPQDVCFRVAVHEIGHAMGLDHNFRGFGLMSTTDVIASGGFAQFLRLDAEAQSAGEKAEAAEAIATLAQVKGEAGISDVAKSRALNAAREKKEKLASALKVLFPANMELNFHPDDLNRLRFGPDVTIRPGTYFENGGPLFSDSNAILAEGLGLTVSPLLESVPFGAPVRVVLRLTNNTDEALSAPAELGFNSGLVCGTVIDPTGRERSFWPIKKCYDKETATDLPPSESVFGALTLIRGAQGALFPIVGSHKIKVRVSWNRGTQRVFREHETDVYISPPVNDAHHILALKLLSTPDVLLSIAIKGKHLKEGNAAIRAAIGNDALKPHFQMPYFMLTALTSVDQACNELTETAVLSFPEVEKIAKILQERQSAKLDYTNVAKILRFKIAQLCAYGQAHPASAERLKTAILDK
jgi:hypothetical protein